MALVSPPTSPLLTNSFQPLSSLPSDDITHVDSNEEPLLPKFAHLASPDKDKKKQPVGSDAPPSDPEKQEKFTWGCKKKQSPITATKKLIWSRSKPNTGVKQSIAARLRSATLKPTPVAAAISSLKTPEVMDTASTQLATRKSLWVQAQNCPNSTMSKVMKRARDKEVGTSSDAGIMNKKIRDAAEEWLPGEISAISLRMWDPTDTQMVLYQGAASEEEPSLIMMLEVDPGTPGEERVAGAPAS